jgi:hypothetical protein
MATEKSQTIEYREVTRIGSQRGEEKKGNAKMKGLPRIPLKTKEIKY